MESESTKISLIHEESFGLAADMTPQASQLLQDKRSPSYKVQSSGSFQLPARPPLQGKIKTYYNTKGDRFLHLGCAKNPQEFKAEITALSYPGQNPLHFAVE